MKKIIIISGILLFGYLSFSVYRLVRYGYSTDMQYNKSYTHLFEESERSKIDTFFFVKESRKSDILTHYWYGKDYSIFIWDIKSLSSLDINKVKFVQSAFYPTDLNLRWGVTLFSDSNPTVFVRSCDFFKNELIVDFGESSQISKRIEHKNYRGIIGRIDQINLRDKEESYKVHIEYTEGLQDAIVVVLNDGKSFYLIIIESKKKLDENILKIFKHCQV